jgi:hypothetical protein
MVNIEITDYALQCALAEINWRALDGLHGMTQALRMSIAISLASTLATTTILIKHGM